MRTRRNDALRRITEDGDERGELPETMIARPGRGFQVAYGGVFGGGGYNQYAFVRPAPGTVLEIMSVRVLNRNAIQVGYFLLMFSPEMLNDATWVREDQPAMPQPKRFLDTSGLVAPPSSNPGGTATNDARWPKLRSKHFLWLKADAAPLGELHGIVTIPANGSDYLKREESRTPLFIRGDLSDSGIPALGVRSTSVDAWTDVVYEVREWNAYDWRKRFDPAGIRNT